MRSRRSFGQQHAQTKGRIDQPIPERPGFGDADMQRRIGGLGELPVSGYRQRHVRGFNANFIILKAFFLQHGGMFEGAFDHGRRAGFAVFFQQVAL